MELTEKGDRFKLVSVLTQVLGADGLFVGVVGYHRKLDVGRIIATEGVNPTVIE
jgi:hypothetical protein